MSLVHIPFSSSKKEITVRRLFGKEQPWYLLPRAIKQHLPIFFATYANCLFARFDCWREGQKRNMSVKETEAHMSKMERRVSQFNYSPENHLEMLAQRFFSQWRDVLASSKGLRSLYSKQVAFDIMETLSGTEAEAAQEYNKRLLSLPSSSIVCCSSHVHHCMKLSPENHCLYDLDMFIVQ